MHARKQAHTHTNTPHLITRLKTRPANVRIGLLKQVKSKVQCYRKREGGGGGEGGAGRCVCICAHMKQQIKKEQDGIK